jgi:hypothetical protein
VTVKTRERVDFRLIVACGVQHAGGEQAALLDGKVGQVEIVIAVTVHAPVLNGLDSQHDRAVGGLRFLLVATRRALA